MQTITVNRSDLQIDKCNVVVPKGTLHLPNESYLEMVLNQETAVWEFPAEKEITIH